MAKYEAHLTADVAHAETVERIATSIGLGCKFSRIDGDAQMGAKPFCYVTAYDHDAETLRGKMRTVEIVLAELGVPTLRVKIERIVFDTKTGVDELAMMERV
jgi:hypothetical protein